MNNVEITNHFDSLDFLFTFLFFPLFYKKNTHFNQTKIYISAKFQERDFIHKAINLPKDKLSTKLPILTFYDPEIP